MINCELWIGLPTCLNRDNFLSVIKYHNGQQTLDQVNKKVKAKTQIAKEYGLFCSTLSTQLKNKNALREAHRNQHLVKQSTIVNYSSHCHFKVSETLQPEPTIEDTVDLPQAVLMSPLQSVGFDLNVTATDFITADDQLPTSEAITDDILLNAIM